MGFLPRDPLFRDDTKGGASPPFGNPRITFGLSVRRWKCLSGLAELGENPKRGPQPPHWSSWGGDT